MSNILINPNSGIIEFTTGTAGVSTFDAGITGGNCAARLSYDNFGSLNLISYVSNITGLDRFTVDGANGRLFSVTDSLSGSLFSVNDIAGLPIIEAFDDNTVIMGAFNRNDFVLTGNSLGLGGLPNTGTTKLLVSGNMLLSGTLTTNQRPFVNGTGVLLSGEAAQVDLSTTVRTTGNQTVSGIKDFQSAPLVSGKEIYFQKNIVYFTGNNFTPDCNIARTFEYVLTGLAGASATLNAPINMGNGENIVIKIKQSSNGSNNLIFNAAYKFPGGVVPSLTLTPSKADIYTALKIDSNFYSTYVKDFIN
jgi:hypothetical protein